MPSSQSFLLYVLQPTVVDTQQICGKRDKRRKLIRDCQDCIPSWFLLRICCLSTITAKQHFVTDCLKSLNLRWTHHLPNCWNAICVLLHCWVFLFVCLVGFLEREIWKRDIHKSDNPPALPFYHYIWEETSRAKNGVKRGSMAGTSKELRAVAL